MKADFLPSPGFIPSGQKLRVEVTKAVSYVEVQADLNPLGKATQAAPLIAFLQAAIDELTPLVPA